MARQPLCADIDGFSLHAAVRGEAHDRKRLEQVNGYTTRPTLSDEWVQFNAAGEVELKLEAPGAMERLTWSWAHWSSCSGCWRWYRGLDCT